MLDEPLHSTTAGSPSGSTLVHCQHFGHTIPTPSWQRFNSWHDETGMPGLPLEYLISLANPRNRQGGRHRHLVSGLNAAVRYRNPLAGAIHASQGNLLSMTVPLRSTSVLTIHHFRLAKRGKQQLHLFQSRNNDHESWELLLSVVLAATESDAP